MHNAADGMLLGDEVYVFPASFAQQRIWFLEQLVPGTALYHLPALVRLSGSLNAGLLALSLGDLVRRHEILRTTFALHEDALVQVVAPELALALPERDLRDVPAADRPGEALRLAVAEAARPFDLERGPLLRALLLRLAAEEWLLVFTMHHSISDAWSRAIVLRELGALYGARAHGRLAALPPLPLQYADVAIWQRETLRDDTLADLVAYWREELRDATPQLALPTDRRRPAARSGRGGVHRFTIDAALTAELRALGRRAGATIFMTLLAAFQALLARLSGQHDLVVGAPVATRGQSQTHGLIGFFVNTLPLRARLADDPSFLAMLARARETTLGAQAHQDLPFEVLVDALKPERSLSHAPFFQVLFVVHAGPQPELELPGLRMQLEPLDLPVAQYDLTLAVDEEADQLQAALEYDGDLFEPETIERLATQLLALLHGAVDDPACRLSRLPLLPPAMRATLLADLSPGGAPAAEACLHELFERQAARTPAALALSGADCACTYAELNRRANQLAHWLLRRGLGRETRIGVCLESSAELIVCLLAILKAGAAYVPLDATHPAERLRYLVEDAGIELVLADDGAPAELAALATVVRPGREATALAALPETNPARPVAPDQIAYVIYTSGSTGRPKGVLVPQRGLAGLARAQIAEFAVAPGSRVLQWASPSVDASIAEIAMALLSGATLCLAPAEGRLPGPDLHATLARLEISVLTLPPSALTLVPAEGLPALATMASAGEPCPAELALRWAPGRRFLNAYGPTECTVCATMGRDEGTGEAPSIGHALAGAELYILDTGLEPVPYGVVGELYVGGPGLARGYVGRPDLTAEAFLPHPFSATPGARLYRTGDLGRYRADGTVEYLGRVDRQLKLRGYRVEPGEIEAAMLRHPGVQAAAVADYAAEDGERRLAGYVVPAADELDLAQLRHFLRQSLPAHMLPARLMRVDTLPRTPAGKLDRQALPPPRPERQLAAPLVAPRDELERRLAQLWAELLGLPQVGVYDSFFALGGDSLQVILLVKQASRAGLQLTPRMVFERQTIAELATALTGQAEQADDAAEEVAYAGPAPLMPSQQWFFEQDFPPPYNWSMTTLLELPEDIDLSLLDQALVAVLRRHDALRARFARGADGRWTQTILSPDAARVCCLTVDFSDVASADVEPLIASTARGLQLGLNLEEGPLLRVVCIGLGPGQPRRLLIILHHLLGDAISFDIFLHDLLAAYLQLAQGAPVRLAPATSFSCWAEQVSAYARGAELRREWESYWLRLPWHEVTPLPLDEPERRADNRVSSEASVVLVLDAAETRAMLKTLAARHGYTMQELLLAALLRAHEASFGCAALPVDVIASGRTTTIADADLSRTVGWLALCPRVLLRRGAADSNAALLAAVRAQLAGLPGGGVGYQLLRHLSDDDAIRARMAELPPAEVIFNYVGPVDHVAPPPALPVRVAPEFRSVEAFREGGSRTRHMLFFWNVAQVDEELRVTLEYSSAIHHRSTAERLLSAFGAALSALAAAGADEHAHK